MYVCVYLERERYSRERKLERERERWEEEDGVQLTLTDSVDFQLVLTDSLCKEVQGGYVRQKKS